MKVIRRITEEVDAYRVGDVISFTLTTGEKVSAMAMKEEEDGTLFVTVDCLEEERPMNSGGTTEGGYEACSLRKVLNSEIYGTFPDEIKDKMVAFENGDYLRLLTYEEVFEENRPEPMRNRRNRIADRGCNSDEPEWWWLQDAVSAARFAFVHAGGYAYCYGGASLALGVRPAFKINI